MTVILFENALFTIPLFTFTFGIIQLSIMTLDKRSEDSTKLATKLKERVKDAKL